MPQEASPTPAGILNGAEQVHRYYKCVDGHDIDGLVSLFAPDAVYCRPGYPPIVGHEELYAFYTNTRMIVEGRHVIDRTVVQADAVAVEGTFAGQLKDGSQTSLRFADFFRIDDGMIRQRDTYFFSPLV